ncbi:protein FAR1-RELATED SEQUENCE 5-like [Silene latifolia]|uniref:protein FAR1-RELATED SEQUENCE 5-like n=1 Tax=Silene latifolia TaxID=37657 RepID=UPI003D77BED0
MSTSDATTSSSTNNSFKTPRTRIETLNALQYIPFCPEEKKPKVGQLFETLESAELFYEEYCTICGFTPRHVTTKRIKGNELQNSFVLRNDVCNRQGVNESRKRKRTDTHTDTAENDAQSDVTDISRVRPITRIDCRALVQFKYQENGTYIVTRFDEAHNHPLVSPESTIFLKGNRKMTEVQKQLVTKVKVLKLGGVKAYRGWKDLCGGYDNIGATEVDFKNFVRDIKTYIGNFDAQMFVDNLIGKKDTSDATYGTNKYDMVFVPFTRVDHHKRCITFGAGLLGDESIDCYRWLFKTFLEEMGGCQPRIIITDQDKSMKSVVPKVFKESTHRLCIWHIMKKLREKVSYQLFQDEDFKTRLNREQWILAYFKDVSISGLMRVTSRSECENSFFDRFHTPHLTVVEFWVCYESDLEAQIHKQSKLNSDNKHSEIPRKKNSNLEVHASEIYSHNIFEDFQKKLVAALSDCRFKDVDKIDEIKIYILTDLHCLWILYNQDFQKIPEQYIMQRWTKAAMSKTVFDNDGKLIDVSQKFSDRKSLSTELWQEVYSCVRVAQCDDNDMKLLIEKLRDIRLDMISNRSVPAKKKGKMKEIEKDIINLIGIIFPENNNLKAQKPFAQ